MSAVSDAFAVSDVLDPGIGAPVGEAPAGAGTPSDDEPPWWKRSYIPDPPHIQENNRLEAEITELWGHINAATYRFLTLLAEYDRREGWGTHGLANCAQWLNWQCGISTVAAREKVRVARALETLPRISAEFARGALSYSKVRAMTRIATPENEADLVNVALHGTASHMDKLVRKYRWVARLREAEQAHEAHRTRRLYFFYDDDGSMILHARLPPEVGAVVRKAIEVAVEALEREGSEQSEELAASEQPEELKASRGCRASSGSLDGSDDGSLDSSDGATAIQTKSNDSAEAAVPAEAPASAEASVLAPAQSSSRARGAAPTGRAAPTPEDAHEEADNHRHARLFEPHSARRVDALCHLAECFLAGQSQRRGSAADRYQVVVHIDQRLLASPPDGRPWNAASATATPADRFALGPLRCDIEDDPESGRPLAIETARRLGCDCSVVGMVETAQGEPLDVGRKTRAIPPALRRALRARDGGCRYPGCGRTRFTDGHHVQHWANGGETKLANLVTLCTFHHRLVHEGGFGVRVTGTGDFEFTRPDGSVVEPNGRVRPALRRSIPLDDTLLRQDPSEPMLFALNREHGLAIDAATSRCGWGGEPMDYSMAIEGLWRHRSASEPGVVAQVPSSRQPQSVEHEHGVSQEYCPSPWEMDDFAEVSELERGKQTNLSANCRPGTESAADDGELPDCLRCWTENSPQYLKLLAELGMSRSAPDCTD